MPFVLKLGSAPQSSHFSGIAAPAYSGRMSWSAMTPTIFPFQRRNESIERSATHLKITPNLHALARQFAMSDNFYVDSDVSADGHRWVVGINPTPFFNTAWTSNYGGRRSEDAFAARPGRRALFGGADGAMPEDEPQYGSLREHIANSGKGSAGILNYGEGLEIEGSNEMDGTAPEGQRQFLNAPLPRPVFESSDRRFPTFNLGIPDQFRASEFERDFRRRLAAGNVPALIVIRLPNDHTMDPRPEDGYPYRASYIADNDLALGRIKARTPVLYGSQQRYQTRAPRIPILRSGNSFHLRGNLPPSLNFIPAYAS